MASFREASGVMKARACVALLALMVASPAAAQETIVEGPGYEITEGTVIHPSVGMTTGLLYNPFYEDTDPASTPVLRLRGAFSIASQGNRPAGELTLLREDRDDGGRDVAPSLDFRATGLVDFEWYASTSEHVSQGLLSGALSARLVTSPRGPVSFFVDDTLMRASSPLNYERAYGRNLNRIINSFAGGLQVRPWGDALRFALQYENKLDVFESPDSSFASRIQHLARGRAEWQLLPLTRFFLDGSWGYFGPLYSGDCGLLKRESRPLRVQLGAASALTELTSLRAHVGYGKGFYQSREVCGEMSAADFSSVLLGAELSHRYSPLGRVSVTYEYDFEDSIEANYFRDHAVVGRVVHQVDRVVLDAGLDIRMRHYDGIPDRLRCDGFQTTRDDVIFRIFGKGYYPYRDWLGFTGQVEMVSDQTDCTHYIDGLADGLGYTRMELEIGAVAAF